MKLLVTIAGVLVALLACLATTVQRKTSQSTVKARGTHVTEVAVRFPELLLLSQPHPVSDGWVWVAPIPQSSHLAIMELRRQQKDASARVLLDFEVPTKQGEPPLAPRLVWMAAPGQAVLLFPGISSVRPTLDGEVKKGPSVPMKPSAGGSEAVPLDADRVLIETFGLGGYDTRTGSQFGVALQGWDHKVEGITSGASDGHELWILEHVGMSTWLSRCEIHYNDSFFSRFLMRPRIVVELKDHAALPSTWPPLKMGPAYDMLFYQDGALWLSHENVLYRVTKDLKLVETYRWARQERAIIVPSGEDLLVLYEPERHRISTPEHAG